MKPTVKRFKLGDCVYHVTDPDQLQMIVTGILHELGGGISYRCSTGGDLGYYFAEELTKERVYRPELN